jgi:hypothetical protein
MNWYFVTIKAHKKTYTSKLDLDGVVTSLKKRIRKSDWSDVYSYELDHSNVLHYHGTFTYSKAINNRYFYSTKDYMVHIVPVESGTLDKVRSYITKDSPCKEAQEQVLDLNYYLNIYAF